MTKRQSIYVEGFSHANPIPAACRVGPLVMTGLITGTDPATGKLAESLADQCRFMFVQVANIMRAAGGGTDDIVRMQVWIKDRSNRGPLNDQWLAMFPDQHDRPARLTVQAADLAGGILIQCEVTAYLGG